MGKEWDKDKGGRDAWIMWLAGIMTECYRLLKPGAHALVWALPRTSHWTAIALEEAGFEIRDVGVHLFGTGFPKSLDVSKAIDAAAGAEREITRVRRRVATGRGHQGEGGYAFGENFAETRPATDAAIQWSGWGTALKPAAEHWILARKPLGEGTVAANVLEWETGALNIDGCRIISDDKLVRSPSRRDDNVVLGKGLGVGRQGEPGGRWPANVTLDEEAAATLDRQSGVLKSGARRGANAESHSMFGLKGGPCGASQGGASRFFYVAKASRADREYGCENLPKKDSAANHHPTVKPLSLMRWLARLITPPYGLILDPFAGSGSTGIAALFEGFRFIGVEASSEYTPIAKARLTKALQDAEKDATAA
jgi:DNA methylase